MENPIIAEIMYDLFDTVPPTLFEKIQVVIKHQENINAIIKKRRKIMRRLKVTLTPAQYHKASVVLDSKEAEMPEPDRITLLENRAMHNYKIANEFDPTDWLSKQEALELMLLQNNEARAFEIDEPWDAGFIEEFKNK